MNRSEEERLIELLKNAMPKVAGKELERDLWPAVLRRIHREPSPPPWFDWALAGGLALMALFFPAAMPVLFYYL
jgi:hypothetical protein